MTLQTLVSIVTYVDQRIKSLDQIDILQDIYVAKVYLSSPVHAALLPRNEVPCYIFRHNSAMDPVYVQRPEITYTTICRSLDMPGFLNSCLGGSNVG